MGTEEEPPKAPAELLERLLDGLCAGVMAVDGSRRFVFVNRQAELLLGIEQGSVLGRELPVVLETNSNPALQAMADVLNKAIEWGEHFRDRTLSVHTDSTYRTLGYTASPLLSAGGRAQGAVLVFDDLTEAKHRVNARLESDSLSMVSQSLAWMGHQVKTALATIQIYAGLAARSAGPEAQSSLAVIRQQVVQAQTRISQSLRVFAPVVEGARLQATDLGAALEDYVSQERLTLPHLTLRLHLEPSSYFVPLAAIDVALLLSNLVCNAAEAMGEAGVIDMRVRTRGRRVRLSVEDSGPGFTEGDPERFLAPFFSSKPRSTGLGLWMVDRVARSVGGSVELENRSEGGARVTLDLPWLQAGDLRGLHMVVGHHEESMRLLLGRHLGNLGVQVRLAATGPELVEHLERERPDLLITNLTLPGIDVAHTVRHLHPAVPVLVLSTVEHPHRLLQQPRPSKVAFLPRPFELQELTLALCYLLWEANETQR